MRNVDANNSVKITEVSLEEMDVICRRCHQLHDEEVLRAISKFFRKLADFFETGEHQQHHSSPHQA